MFQLLNGASHHISIFERCIQSFAKRAFVEVSRGIPAMSATSNEDSCRRDSRVYLQNRWQDELSVADI